MLDLDNRLGAIYNGLSKKLNYKQQKAKFGSIALHGTGIFVES